MLSYVGVKTLDLLREIAKGVSVKIYSDNCSFETLTEQMQKDFLRSRPDVSLKMKETIMDKQSREIVTQVTNYLTILSLCCT